MGDERKITDCEHFLHGTCTFADACFYRHPMKLREPAIVCKFWQSYSCVNYYCQFLHPAVIPPQPAYTPRLVAEPTAKASIVCAYYMSGRCSKPSCPFMHSLPDATNSRHPQSTAVDEENKEKYASDILSKYSMRQTIEKTTATIAEEKLRELDRKLDQYQTLGAVSLLGKNTVKDSNDIQISKKIKINDINSNNPQSNDNSEIQKNIGNEFISLS